MIIRITDKIFNLIKSYVKQTIDLIFDIVTTIGTISLMLITIIYPNFFTFILSIILYLWGDKRGNMNTTFLCVFLMPIMVMCYIKS